MKTLLFCFSLISWWGCTSHRAQFGGDSKELSAKAGNAPTAGKPDRNIRSLSSPVIAEGDAQKGQAALLHHSFDQGGAFYAMSPEEFNNIYLVWPADRASKAKSAGPAERRKMIREYYGLFLNPGNTDEDLDVPPLGFITVQDGKLWQASCTMCHAGAVKQLKDGLLVDQVMLGVGNNRLDLTSLLEDRYLMANQFPKVSNLPLERGLYFKSSWKSFSDRLTSHSRGTVDLQQGVALNLYLRNNRDLSLDPVWNLQNWIRTFANYNLDVGPKADVDVPPWWNTREKTHLYSSGLIPNQSKSLATSFLAIGNDSVGWNEKYDPDLMAFINSVEPPPYIFTVDSQRADQGRVLFNNTCAKCHGTYDVPSHPVFQTNYVPAKVTGTDPNASQPWGRALRIKWAQSWLGDYGAADVKIDPKGYVAPPLKGIWSTAPYLHNGSIPTLADLLMIKKSEQGEWVESTARPARWRAHYEGYDQEKVGLEFDTDAAADATSPHEQREYFDTTDAPNGKLNTGHMGKVFYSFGKGDDRRPVTAQEKGLILEYLKTL